MYGVGRLQLLVLSGGINSLTELCSGYHPPRPNIKFSRGSPISDHFLMPLKYFTLCMLFLHPKELIYMNVSSSQG